MRTSSPQITFFVAGCALAGARPQTAHACSPARCAPSVFLPVSGQVPSNAVEFLWQPPWSGLALDPEAYSVHLYVLEGGQRREIESEVIAGPEEGLKRVRPKQPVAQGSVLVLDTTEPSCGVAAPTPAMVAVSPPAPTPTQLGNLEIGETHASTVMNIPTNRGSCRADFEVASVQIKLSLDAGAQPFADSMRHALLVDGTKRRQPSEPPPIGNWYPLGGKLEDVLYTLCKGPSDSWTADLAPGTHRVQWLATLPDGTELRSDEISIELQCASAGDAGLGADASTDLQAPPAQEATESVADATDASAPPSDRDDGNTESAANEPSADETRQVESCALSTHPSERTSHAWLASLAVALLCWRRARRRPSAR